ncbi:MAG TPA: transposase [Anaerovoracaceae bacterium]|nr:transposase [Anaerovoracaceae bacterium]
MSFAANNYQQMNFNDKSFSLTEREMKMLEKSWAKDFSEHIFPSIDESKFACIYSDKASRPNTPVNVIVGALVLKELLVLSDEEIVDSLMFDTRFQYALHTTSFKEQPLSDRSLSRFRERCNAYEAQTGNDLIHDCVVLLSKEMAGIMNIHSNLKRMDSLMVASNIKKMSRLELLYTCVANLVKLMHQKQDDSSLSGLEHYYEADDHNRVIYYNRSMETTSKIDTILADAKRLIPVCAGSYDEISEYQLLLRVINEQTAADENGNYHLKTKEDNSMNSEVLQNPSDPEATYRFKAGKSNRGYIANVVEDVNENASIVTEYSYETNNHSDSQFLKETIDTLGVQTEKTVLVADGAYSGDDNQKLANDNNIQLVTTSLTGREANEFYADFKFSEDGKNVIECPNGCTPKSCNYIETSGQCRISFTRSQCENCPHKNECHPKVQKRTTSLLISVKTVDRANYQKQMKTEEFKAYARMRNGVETIPSILRRKYRIDQMPVRGKQKTKLYFGFKIAALNFNKLFRYLNSLDRCEQNASFA